MFKDNNYIVHVATNTDCDFDYCDKKINLGLSRNPFSFKNISALIKLRKIIKKDNYDIISCHTPVGGFLGRCCIIRNKVNTKVFYTVHGFHFYKGSGLLSKLYYLIEKYLSKYTDCLIVMNDEDYIVASRKFHCPVYKINGIGYDDKRLLVKNKNLKNELGLDNYFIVTYIAEVSKRKNQLKLIQELKKYDLEKEKIKILLIGDSIIKGFEKKLNNNIMYIDFVNNVGDYLYMSDMIISSSLQEGLPLGILEAMCFKKRIIALNIRGNNDLLKDYPKGIMVSNIKELVREIINNKDIEDDNINYDISKYHINKVIKTVKKIYNYFLKEKLK